MRYLLIGGTGTLGQALVKRLYNPSSQITIFSRDEAKQQAMRRDFPLCRYVVGDVRDKQAVQSVMAGVDVVFLLAAIKHVDVAESNPLEAIKTNVMGAVTVAEAAIEAGVRHVIFTNTDKAVLPITTYGYTKALAQNFLLSRNIVQSRTKFSAFNYGNVIASKGSVVPYFVFLLKSGQTIPITDVRMSRFWWKIDAAADFVLENYEKAPMDRAMIPPLKGASVVRIVGSLARLLGVKSYEIKTVGLRGTEKIYEVLEANHDQCFRSDTADQYSEGELDDLLQDYAV